MLKGKKVKSESEKREVGVEKEAYVEVELNSIMKKFRPTKKKIPNVRFNDFVEIEMPPCIDEATDQEINGKENFQEKAIESLAGQFGFDELVDHEPNRRKIFLEKLKKTLNFLSRYVSIQHLKKSSISLSLVIVIWVTISLIFCGGSIYGIVMEFSSFIWLNYFFFGDLLCVAFLNAVIFVYLIKTVLKRVLTYVHRKIIKIRTPKNFLKYQSKIEGKTHSIKIPQPKLPAKRKESINPHILNTYVFPQAKRRNSEEKQTQCPSPVIPHYSLAESEIKTEQTIPQSPLTATDLQDVEIVIDLIKPNKREREESINQTNDPRSPRNNREPKNDEEVVIIPGEMYYDPIRKSSSSIDGKRLLKILKEERSKSESGCSGLKIEKKSVEEVRMEDMYEAIGNYGSPVKGVGRSNSFSNFLSHIEIFRRLGLRRKNKDPPTPEKKEFDPYKDMKFEKDSKSKIIVSKSRRRFCKVKLAKSTSENIISREDTRRKSVICVTQNKKTKDAVPKETLEKIKSNRYLIAPLKTESSYTQRKVFHWMDFIFDVVIAVHWFAFHLWALFSIPFAIHTPSFRTTPITYTLHVIFVLSLTFSCVVQVLVLMNSYKIFKEDMEKGNEELNGVKESTAKFVKKVLDMELNS